MAPADIPTDCTCAECITQYISLTQLSLTGAWFVGEESASVPNVCTQYTPSLKVGGSSLHSSIISCVLSLVVQSELPCSSPQQNNRSLSQLCLHYYVCANRGCCLATDLNRSGMWHMSHPMGVWDMASTGRGTWWWAIKTDARLCLV